MDMKRLTILTIILCIGSLAIAQVSHETEFKITVGDTIEWKPFGNCDRFEYNISDRLVISSKPIKYGDRFQIIAKQAGNSRIMVTCIDDNTTVLANIIVSNPNEAPVTAKTIEKPDTQTFTDTYQFAPPADHFFISVSNPRNNCQETFVKVGDNEAFNDGQGTDRLWNIKTGKNWFYRPDAQGWTIDVDWDFEPFGASFFPLNTFVKEVNQDDLSQYYVGMEKVLDVNCWKFFVEQSDGSVIQYWVDPTNGCTLKRQVNNDEPRMVTVYDLKYTKLNFGPSFKKSMHDTTR